MRKRIPVLLVAVVAVLAAGGLSGAASADPGQHGPTTGHLLDPQLPAGMTQDEFGAWGKLSFVGQVTVHDAEPGLIGDLAVDPDHDYAYLARWGGEACAGPEGGGKDTFDGGVYIIDIRDPSNPVEVGFIATHQDTLVGEGMQVVEITTSKFSGDVLVINHEQCGKNGKGGVSLWDITNPLKPKKLSENFGDITVNGARDTPDVNQTHSAFAWDAGDRAYLVATDDEEATDVDIFDITDPKHPVLIAELDLNEFDVAQPDLELVDSFLHDMVVKQIGDRWIMLLSYWDGGYVLLDVTDPANPVFLGDSEFTNPDPELLEQTGIALTPEGNAHQAEFTIDNRFVIGTDEDFGPFRLLVQTDEGDEFRAAPGEQTSEDEATGVSGTTVFVGRACDVDPAVPAAPDVGTSQIAVVERGLCTFQEKVENVIAAGGYEAVIIFNREGSDACLGVFTPGFAQPEAIDEMPVIFVSRLSGFDLFDIEGQFDLGACLDATIQRAPLEIGTIGDVVTGVTAQFDGWGYVHLFGVSLGATSATLTELDTFAIPEAMDPDFADGFGDLTVHEVAVDPQEPTLAYLSYYSGGIRAIQIQCTSATSCQLVEVGGFIDNSTSQPDGPAGPLVGNNFWGVETFTGPDCNGNPDDDPDTYILGSDRDSGLWILCDP